LGFPVRAEGTGDAGKCPGRGGGAAAVGAEQRAKIEELEHSRKVFAGEVVKAGVKEQQRRKDDALLESAEGVARKFGTAGCEWPRGACKIIRCKVEAEDRAAVHGIAIGVNSRCHRWSVSFAINKGGGYRPFVVTWDDWWWERVGERWVEPGFQAEFREKAERRVR
jgi:hypothetical protein